MAVSARDALIVGSGSEVTDANGQPGVVASRNGAVQIQSGAQVGTVWTKGTVTVTGHAIVSDALFASASNVSGGAVAPARQDPVGEPAQVSLNVTFPSASQGDVDVAPDGSRDLAPGRYGALRLAPRATLRLVTGTYYFDSYTLEPDSRIEVDNRTGTAVINVRADMVHKGRLVHLGAASDVIVTSFSSGAIEIGNTFEATLVATEAAVTVKRPQGGAAHAGQIFGRSVTLSGGAIIAATRTTTSGPAIGDLNPTHQPGSGVPLPGPVPSPEGLGYDEWQQVKNAYITQLIESGYNGPVIQFPAHPDAKRIQDIADYALPAGADTTGTPAPAIPARDTGVFPNPGAEQELRADIVESETGIVSATRFSYLNQPDSTNSGVYGTDAQVEDVPEKCVFSATAESVPVPTDHNGQPIGDFATFMFKDLVDPVILGDKPDYLVDRPNDSGFDYNADLAPEFDGYWFFQGRLRGGWNGVGMEGRVDAGMFAGIVALNKHQELLRFLLTADGAILKQREPGGPVSPYFASSLETKLLDKQFDFLPHWDEAAGTNDPLFGKLKRNLLDRTVLMFPDATAPRVQVGPFALILNGGAEVKIPLSLNLDETGPEVTVAPMFRVYVTVFAGIDVVVASIGLKGEADIVRVDLPFKAKLKWRDYMTPETCYSSADFDVTFQSIWSTLNGNLKVSVKAWLPIIGDIDIVDEEIVSWTGLEYDTGEHSLLPTVSLPLMKYEANRCSLGQASCFETAQARVTNVPDSWSVDVPYTNSECPQQHVYEIDMNGRGLSEVWLRHLWDVTDINNEAMCTDSLVRVFVRVQNNSGNWSAWDEYNVRGVWNGTACETDSRGLIGPGGERNTLIGFPFSWVDTTNVSKVRVAVAGGTQCAQRRLVLGTTDTL